MSHDCMENIILRGLIKDFKFVTLVLFESKIGILFKLGMNYDLTRPIYLARLT